ncbi:MAG TPA: TolC family protein [Gemmatimonadales bacterium]|nr:TolC family protein [Gemmatimonadales bacterium]
MDASLARRSLVSTLSTLAAAATLGGLGACVGTPRVAGVAGAAPAPNVPWTPPPSAVRAQLRTDSVAHAAPPALPADLAERIHRLTLAEVVDLALRNNTATRIAWANAQAAAASYGSATGEWLPTVDGNVSGARVKTAASQGRTAVQQWVFTPSVSLSYLLFDFGGRTGRVSEAKQTLLAAGFGHNAAIQDVILQSEVAYFNYVQSRALLEAQRTTLREAEANLAATEERRRVGLATIADVLQARTAASRAALNLQTTEGQVQTTRGALALALGVPANLPYDIDSTAAEVPIAQLADSVETIIATAIRQRPDLAAARAQAEAAHARISQLRAARLPALAFSANGGRTYTTNNPSGANSYTLQLGLSIPLFAGFSRAYDQRAAEFRAEAAAAQAEQVRQRVVYDVFASYYDLQTSTRRVRTAEDLLASATQSSEVALARYKAGVGTILDLLNAQSALADARNELIQSRLAWSVSLAQLAHDAGLLDTRGGSPLRLTPVTLPDSTQTPNR